MDVFKSLDTNNDGKLSKDELITGYKKHLSQIDAEIEVQKIMTVADSDGSGYIDFTEFVTATIDKKNLLSKERIETAFKLFDKDGSGSISVDELKFLLGGKEEDED